MSCNILIAYNKEVNHKSSFYDCEFNVFETIGGINKKGLEIVEENRVSYIPFDIIACYSVGTIQDHTQETP